MKRILIALTLLLAAVSAHADTLVTIAPEARIEATKSQTFTVNVTPEMLQRKLALSVLARLDSPNLGGSTYVMQITVNGTLLDLRHLLNKQPETEMLGGMKLDWYGQSAWRIVYAPDYESCNGTGNPASELAWSVSDFTPSF